MNVKKSKQPGKQTTNRRGTQLVLEVLEPRDCPSYLVEDFGPGIFFREGLGPSNVRPVRVGIIPDMGVSTTPGGNVSPVVSTDAGGGNWSTSLFPWGLSELPPLDTTIANGVAVDPYFQTLKDASPGYTFTDSGQALADNSIRLKKYSAVGTAVDSGASVFLEYNSGLGFNPRTGNGDIVRWIQIYYSSTQVPPGDARLTTGLHVDAFNAAISPFYPSGYTQGMEDTVSLQHGWGYNIWIAATYLAVQHGGEMGRNVTIWPGFEWGEVTRSVAVPRAGGMGARTATDQPVTVDFLANSSVPSGDTAWVSAVGTPSNGSAVNNYDGTVTYTPTTSFKGSDSFTVTVTDGTTTSTATVYVTVDPATHFNITASSPTLNTNGYVVTYTATALDAEDDTATWYNDTIHVTSSDYQADLPDDMTMASGVATFDVTYKTAGEQFVRVSDPVDWSVASDTESFSVSPADAQFLAISTDGATTTGSAFGFTVSALDPYGNIATGYTGTLQFTSSGDSSLPGYSTLTGGVGSFNATLYTWASQTLSVTDMADGGLTATFNPLATTHFAITETPGSVTTGGSFTFTVTALDVFAGTANAYRGTVLLTSSDDAAGYSGNVSLAGGVGTFSATLVTTGTQTLTATDTADDGVTGTSSNITVINPPAYFVVSASESSITSNSTVTVTITAYDGYGALLGDYNQTVVFTVTTATEAEFGVTGGSSVSWTDGVGTTTINVTTNSTTAVLCTIHVTDPYDNGIFGTFDITVTLMVSDRRLKERIVRVGEVRGIAIYEFDYIGRVGRYRGVMAQDLLLSHPEAVVLRPNGYYAVNYAKLGVEFRRVA